MTGIGFMSPGTPTAFINFKETPNITRNTTGFYADSAASNSTLGIEQGAAGFPNIYADLSTATPVSINDLRQSIQLQRLLERDARGGTRYVELLKSHWGVVSPDFRLQRPEYLGGSSHPINVTAIPQTSNTRHPARRRVTLRLSAPIRGVPVLRSLSSSTVSCLVFFRSVRTSLISRA